MARPTKWSAAAQARICQAIAAGNYLEAAAAYGGVTYATLWHWMALGRKATTGRYFEFFKAVAAAESAAEVRVVAQWQAQIPENWQAARDFLARRFPERWGVKERHQHEVSGRDGGPVPVRVQLHWGDALTRPTGPSGALGGMPEHGGVGDNTANGNG